MSSRYFSRPDATSGRAFLHERREPIDVIADDESLDHRPVDEQRAQVGPSGIRRCVISK